MNLEDSLKQLAVIRRDLRQLEGEYDGLKWCTSARTVYSAYSEDDKRKCATTTMNW